MRPIPVALAAEMELGGGEQDVQERDIFREFLSFMETDTELIHVEEIDRGTGDDSS